MVASKLRVEKYLRWERPHRGWFKLNTDGSWVTRVWQVEVVSSAMTRVH